MVMESERGFGGGVGRRERGVRARRTGRWSRSEGRRVCESRGCEGCRPFSGDLVRRTKRKWTTREDQSL